MGWADLDLSSESSLNDLSLKLLSGGEETVLRSPLVGGEDDALKSLSYRS